MEQICMYFQFNCRAVGNWCHIYQVGPSRVNTPFLNYISIGAPAIISAASTLSAISGTYLIF